MKTEALHALITARALYDRAQEMCVADDRYQASAGLIVLQDAIELVLRACLIEIGADEERDLGKPDFAELIGELIKRGVKVKKAGTLRALNKQRVVIKHYGQLAEPETVRTYLHSSKLAIDALLADVHGTDLQGVMLDQLIKKEDIRNHIRAAYTAIEEKKLFDSLVETRKAIYLAVEQDFSVEDWKGESGDSKEGMWGLLGRGGYKAPWHTKNKEWIAQNVKDVFDYVQFDHERLRLDLIEWGVTTQDFWNLWRLTPAVYWSRESKKWHEMTGVKYVFEAATEANARYCLDRAISLIIKQQNHLDLSRWLNEPLESPVKVRLKCDESVYGKATRSAEARQAILAGTVVELEAVVRGLDSESNFAKVCKRSENITDWVWGYVPYESCEFVNEEE